MTKKAIFVVLTAGAILTVVGKIWNTPSERPQAEAKVEQTLEKESREKVKNNENGHSWLLRQLEEIKVRTAEEDPFQGKRKHREALQRHSELNESQPTWKF